MVLKWPFIGETGEDFAFNIQVSQDTELFVSVNFNLEDDLEMAFC